MTLSKRGDYVVRSALCLARAYPEGSPRKIREVVAEMGVPQTFASQILSDLVKAGLATSRAGKDGGYRLARPPEDVSLLEVVEAGEGPLRAERCALGDGPCRWDTVCPLHEPWREATAALRGVLAATTLADMASTDRDLEAGAVPAPEDAHRHIRASNPFAERIEIDAPRDAVVQRLDNDSWLAEPVKAACNEVEALRTRIDPDGPAWSVTNVAVVVDPVGGGQETDPVLRHVAWETVTVEGLNTHGEATMELTALDPERTVLAVTGRLRPPVRPEAPSPDPAAAQHLADAVVRSCMRRVATALELTPGRRRRERAVVSGTP